MFRLCRNILKGSFGGMPKCGWEAIPEYTAGKLIHWLLLFGMQSS